MLASLICCRHCDYPGQAGPEAIAARFQVALDPVGAQRSRSIPPRAEQRPVSAKALHGAHLTIYDDELVDNSYYLDGSLKFDRKPGNGLVVASGPNPDTETYEGTVTPR